MTDAWKQWEGEVVDGRFRLAQFLGGSDHSAVFLAEAGPPTQKVALKFVDANPATAQLQLSRWERAAKLSHPHLLQILQSGRCQLGRATMLYVVSEFAQENLSQILPNRPLNPTEAEYMLRSVLEVLAYLHGQGLAHGRLKPGNIMAVHEELKVSGDSISRPGERPLGQAQPTVYDPPEITTSGLSPSGDMWSLGVTLVEVLTQHASVGDGIRQGDLALPESLPPPFLEIARQCLRLDPQRRWTVPDIAARLLPAPAPPKKKTSLRYGIAAAAAGIIVVGVLAGSKYTNHDSQSGSVSEPGIAQPKASENAEGQPKVPPVDANAAKNSTKPDVINNGTAAGPPPEPAPVSRASTVKVPGSVTEQFLPPVSRKSRDTITGKVRVGVKVRVDTSGKVLNASLVSPGPSQYFAKLALEASRRWKFAPPQANGQPVASEWMLRFYFGRQGTEVHPTQTAP
jgi:serine/threonine-protein kinase Stk1